MLKKFRIITLVALVVVASTACVWEPREWQKFVATNQSTAFLYHPATGMRNARVVESFPEFAINNVYTRVVLRGAEASDYLRESNPYSVSVYSVSLEHRPVDVSIENIELYQFGEKIPFHADQFPIPLDMETLYSGPSNVGFLRLDTPFELKHEHGNEIVVHVTWKVRTDESEVIETLIYTFEPDTENAKIIWLV